MMELGQNMWGKAEMNKYILKKQKKSQPTSYQPPSYTPFIWKLCCCCLCYNCLSYLFIMLCNWYQEME